MFITETKTAWKPEVRPQKVNGRTSIYTYIYIIYIQVSFGVPAVGFLGGTSSKKFYHFRELHNPFRSLKGVDFDNLPSSSNHLFAPQPKVNLG